MNPIPELSRCARSGTRPTRAAPAAAHKGDPTPRVLPRLQAALAGTLLTVAALGMAHAASPRDLLADYSRQAGTAVSLPRGQALFTESHGREWRCASCHGNLPTASGRHAATGKPIEPLAPAFNARRFTDAAKAEKWFRRNCNDVLGRECSAGEKADLLAWLLSLER